MLKKVQIWKVRKDNLDNNRTGAGKAKAQKRYAIANKDVKSSIKRNMQTELYRKSCKASSEWSSAELKVLYETTRKLSGKKRKNDIPVTDKNGKTLTKQEDQWKRWAEPTSKSFLTDRHQQSRPISRQLPIHFPSIPANLREPKLQTLKKLKTGNAPGPDSIPQEAIKADIQISSEMIHELFEQIWPRKKKMFQSNGKTDPW